GAGKGGGVLEGLSSSLTKGGKHRVRRVPEQADAAVHPRFERIAIVEAPLRRTNDRPRQSDEVVSAGVPRERLVNLANDLFLTDGKPVALLLLERGGVGLIMRDPHVQQLAAAHPIRRCPAPVG